MPFKDITPSTAAVQPEMEVGYPAKPTSLDDFVSPSGLANVVRPEDPTKPIVVPAGKTPGELKTLGAMLESHLPEVRKSAREHLAQVYPSSAEVLVAVLGRWSNESFNEAKATFLEIGPAAVPVLIQALASDGLYVRYHARELLARLSTDSDRPAVVARLREALSMDNPLDRRSAAQALGVLRDPGSATLLRARLDDADWDVVHAAATSLAALRDRDAVPQMRSALLRARWPETHRALAVALASLGSSAGIQQLIHDLDNDDELQRQYTFTALFSILGRHFGYEPDAPASERKFAVSRLQAWWTEEGGDALVHAPQHVDPAIHARAWKLIEELGGGTDTAAGGDDVAIQNELLALGDGAIPALIEGLTFPSGYAEKRSLCCQLLGRLGTREAAPYLAAALRDPNSGVADWACWALEHCGDADTLPQLRRYQDRIPSLLGVERGAGATAPGDQLLARAARVRWVLGDAKARDDLVNLLSSRNEMARKISIQALRERYGDDRGYDPDADAASRVEAEMRWREP
jgi:HEAT repeat protein